MMEQESWAGLGSTLASLMFLWAVLRKYFPTELKVVVKRYTSKLMDFLDPYVNITIPEYTGERFKRSDAYIAVQSYLIGSTSKEAKRLKVEVGKGINNLVLSMDDREEVTDEFRGIKLWWTASKRAPFTQTMSCYPPHEDISYRLTFHHSHRQLVLEEYLNHVIEEGKAIRLRNRQRKLYTNNSSQNWYRHNSAIWSHVPFEHPGTFKTLAMDPEKKEEIIQDLLTFSKAKDYYTKIGKAWKRGYLLYGPPGTGKSTMIAAMANFLDYDVYDLELTAVKNNTELRKLFIETTSKSIIVIEDIDCSLDLSGQRKKAMKKMEGDDENEKKLPPKPDKEESSSNVTLSGLLNFIDGLWSSCGGERIIIFTTNYVDKLDPALIRKGRMDKHIELSYCSFEGFKVLAKNYLDLNSHPLFETICQMMKDINITPANVAECLMPKSSIATPLENTETCLKNLIRNLHKAKEKAIRSKENSRVKTARTDNGEKGMLKALDPKFPPAHQPRYWNNNDRCVYC
ncbi:AAA-ATPase At3g28580-like [Tasmannia lanceolata]|uniref:AAA-ATPase At3g28580-like n=1 Tax=Tasmannia lanceolata TaxID=3420 RepID=UPI00406487D4